MTVPLGPPAKKNPQQRIRLPTLPPDRRSRAALGLAAAAAEGRFMLQTCEECNAVQYPPRDACASCLSVALTWKDVPRGGRLLADTIVHASTSTYFRERAPWRVGTVRLDSGPSLICHLHGDCKKGERVQMRLQLDKAGHGVLFAMPAKDTPDMQDDPQLRELTSGPKFRRVLITDARSDNAVALVRAFADAGASIIFVGEAEAWRPYPQRSRLEQIAGVEIVPLDVTDMASVKELGATIGGKVDILVNNARFIRPGGIIDRGDVNFARDEIEVNYLGLMRLAQAFAPAMLARGADGQFAATAWVNILSVYAYANRPDFGSFSASNAAALSLSHCLRAELRPGGVRVVNVFAGPTEDAWHQPLPAPKVGAEALAKSVVGALRDGLEDVFAGDVAKDLIERWRAGPKILEREMILQGPF